MSPYTADIYSALVPGGAEGYLANAVIFLVAGLAVDAWRKGARNLTLRDARNNLIFGALWPFAILGLMVFITAGLYAAVRGRK